MRAKELALKLDALRMIADDVETHLFWAKTRAEKDVKEGDEAAYLEREKSEREAEALRRVMDKLAHTAFQLVKEWSDEQRNPSDD